MYKNYSINDKKHFYWVAIILLLFIVVILVVGCDINPSTEDNRELVVLIYPKQVWYLSPNEIDSAANFSIDLGYRDNGRLETQEIKSLSKPYGSEITFAVQPDDGTLSVDSNGKITVLKSEAELFGNGQNSVETNITISFNGSKQSIDVRVVPRPYNKITLDGNGVDLSSNVVWVWDNRGKTFQDLFVEQNIVEPEPPTGFRFEGWYHVDGDGKPISNQKQNLEERCYLTEDITLVARYLSKENLLLDAEGFAENSELSRLYYHEPLPESVLNKLSESVPVSQYDGWEFGGWYSEPGGTGDENGTNDDFFCANSAHLYAKWSGTCNLHLTKKLEYVFNDGEWAGETAETAETVGSLSSETNSIHVVYHADLQLSTPVYPNGGKFVGWRTELYGKGEKFDSNDKYMLTALDLFDCFSYQINFYDADGKSLVERDFDAIYGQNVNEVAPADCFKPLNEEQRNLNGWEFDGWTTNIGGHVKNIEEYIEYPYIETEDRTVMEKWRGTLTLVADITNWNEDDNNWEKQIEIIYNDKLLLPQNIDLLASTSWQIGGWFTEEYGSGEEKTSVEKYVDIGTITLHAKIVMEGVALKLLDENVLPAMNIVYGKTIEDTLQRKLPKKEEMEGMPHDGYMFGDGWYAAEEKIDDDTRFFPKDMTDLYYELKPLMYTVSFNLNCGTYNGSKEMAPIEVCYGEYLPNLQHIPAKHEGSISYTFGGFTYNGTEYYSPAGKGAVWNITEDVKLEAQWIDHSYTVKLNQDKEVPFDENYDDAKGTSEVRVGYNFPFPSDAKAPIRAGYTFQGYFENENGQGTQYYDKNMKSLNVWNQDQDGEIYAHFTKNALNVELTSTSISGIKKDSTSQCRIKVSGGSGNYNLNLDKKEYSGVTVKHEQLSNDPNYQYVIKITANAKDQTGTIGITITDTRTKIDSPKKELKYSTESSCLATGTLITLADGSQVPVEQLTGEELLLVWNLYTGTFDVAPILFVDSDPAEEYEIIHLYFSDGTEVKVIGEHAFWDFNLNKYVFLRSDATQYVGHWFNKQTGDRENLVWTKVQLTSVVLEHEFTMAWSPVTFGHLCYYVNGMLSMPGNTEGFVNIFDVDAETMKIDEQKMAEDIEQYGLFTYDDFADYIPEEIFEAFGGQYLKVAMGKGLLTWDDIFALVDRYKVFWE